MLWLKSYKLKFFLNVVNNLTCYGGAQKLTGFCSIYLNKHSI